MLGQSTADGQIQVRIPKDLRSEIEKFRRDEPDIPTRPEAIRRLLRQAVRARQEGIARNLHQRS
jgi:hypothetical protein